MKCIAEGFRDLVQAIDRLAQVAVACLVGFMVVLVFAQVIFRYVVVRPIFWGDELSRYLFVWISFVGAGVAMGGRLHYGFDYLVGKFPPGMRRAVGISMTLLAGAFLVLCVILGIGVVQIVAAQRSPSLQVSMAWVYAALPVGSALLILHLIDQAVTPPEENIRVSGPE